MSSNLTDKQAAFVREYLVDLNAAAAARRAGYSESTARAIGAENLTKPHIAAALQAAMDERSKRTEITADRVLKELARIGFSDIRDLFTWSDDRTAYVPSDDLTEDQAAAISSVKSETTHYTREDGESETKIKLELKTYDKLGALEKIGKHLGMFVDRTLNFGFDMSALPEEALERIAAGEDPMDVVASMLRSMQAGSE